MPAGEQGRLSAWLVVWPSRYGASATPWRTGLVSGSCLHGSGGLLAGVNLLQNGAKSNNSEYKVKTN